MRVDVGWDQYVAALLKSGLIDVSILEAIAQSLDSGGEPRSPDRLAEELIRRRLLTPFQAERLLVDPSAILVLDDYVLLEQLGSGGMGRVYKAQHRRLKRVVALKTLPAALAGSSENVAHFQREVEAAGKLEHTNIIATYDAGEAHGIPFLVMQYVDGRDLQSLIHTAGPLSVSEALHCLYDAARGLAYAHEQGIVHRDIKPGNLMLGSDGIVRILDMGLAWTAHQTAQSVDGDSSANDAQEVPPFMGTADFLAPERVLDPWRADARSDLYSLGYTLYYLLTARPPYPKGSIEDKLRAHRDHAIPPLRAVRGDVPEPVEAIYQSLVAKRPDDRPTAEQLLARLRTCGVPHLESPTVLAGAIRHAPSELRPVSLNPNATRPSSVPAQTADAAEEQESETLDLPRRLARPYGRQRYLYWAGWLLIPMLATGLVGQRWLAQNRGSSPDRDVAAVADQDDVRAAVAWVLQMGGTLQVQRGDHWFTVNQPSELPGDPLRIKTIQLGGRVQVTDDGLEHLRDIQELEMVWLGGTSITDQGLAAVGTLVDLRYLSLTDTPISADGLPSLATLENLDTLRLAGTQVRDEGLRHVAPLASLSVLDLQNTAISDAGLEHLHACTNLRKLWLQGTRCSQAGIERLRERLPHCDIMP